MLTWLMFLPWALWDDCQWLTIPVAAIITFLLVAIENIGIQVCLLLPAPAPYCMAVACASRLDKFGITKAARSV